MFEIKTSLTIIYFIYTVNSNGKDGKPKGIPLKGSQKEMLLAQSTAVDSPSKRKGLNLSSTSLILFEEVRNNLHTFSIGFFLFICIL